MKKITIEVISILAISLIISLIYSATSTTGIILLKRAFKIKAEIRNVITATDSGESQKYLMRRAQS